MQRRVPFLSTFVNLFTPGLLAMGLFAMPQSAGCGKDQEAREAAARPAKESEPSGRQRILMAVFQAGFWLRAGGNEPGWTLLAGPQTIRLDLQGRPGAGFPGLAAGELEDGGVIVREAGPRVLISTSALAGPGKGEILLSIDDPALLDTRSDSPLAADENLIALLARHELTARWLVPDVTAAMVNGTR